ncbi:MAG: molybdopterin-dependent oxidoreductase [Acidaminobacteraceae bacterium]
MTYKKNGVYNTVCPRDCYGVCSLKVTIEDNQVRKVIGNTNNKNSDGHICLKGASYAKRIYHPDRVTHPMLKDKDTGLFNEVSWELAYQMIKDKLNTYKLKYGSQSIMYLSGWGHTGVFNSYANSFWSQFGIVSSTYGSLCMAGGKAGIKYTYGNDIKHSSNSTLINAKLIIVWGANPANTNIHRMRNIKLAIKNGSKLIVVDPRISESMTSCSLNIHPRPGTDALLATAIAKLIIERNICDYDFIEKNVLGFDEYKKNLDNYTLDDIVEKTNVSLSQISKIVDLIEESPIYALVSGTGKSRYTNAGQTERAICILPALTGSIGKIASGFYFSDGQQANLIWPYIPEQAYDMKSDIHVGMLAYELDKQTPDIKMMWIEKANPVTSSPDVNAFKKAFEKLEFIVTVEHFMSDTALLSDLVLPSAMFSEKDDLHCVYGDSYIHLLQKLTDPVGECKSEPEIYRELGDKLGMNLSYLPIINEDMINKLLDFNHINTSYHQLSKEPYLSTSYTDIAFKDLIFNTPSGKIEFYSEYLLALGESPLPLYKETVESKYDSPELYKKYPLHFLSAHSAYRINSQFKEMKLSKKHDQARVQINPVDSDFRGISSGDKLKIYNDRGEIFVLCEITDAVSPGLIHIYEGWGEEYNASVNKLTKGRKTDIGNGTAFHDCLVEVCKV